MDGWNTIVSFGDPSRYHTWIVWSRKNYLELTFVNFETHKKCQPLPLQPASSSHSFYPLARRQVYWDENIFVGSTWSLGIGLEKGWLGKSGMIAKWLVLKSWNQRPLLRHSRNNVANFQQDLGSSIFSSFVSPWFVNFAIARVRLSNVHPLNTIHIELKMKVYDCKRLLAGQCRKYTENTISID